MHRQLGSQGPYREGHSAMGTLLEWPEYFQNPSKWQGVGPSPSLLAWVHRILWSNRKIFSLQPYILSPKIRVFNHFVNRRILCVWVFCLHVCTMYMQYPQRPERGHQLPEKWRFNGCELSCQCWKLNPGPLQGQPVLLTTAPSFQLELTIFKQKL